MVRASILSELFGGATTYRFKRHSLVVTKNNGEIRIFCFAPTIPRAVVHFLHYVGGRG